MCNISPTFAEVPEGRSRTFAWSTPWRTETWVGNRAPFCLLWIKGPCLWNDVSPCQSYVICRLDFGCSVHSRYRGIIMFYHVYWCIQNLTLRVWFWLSSFFLNKITVQRYPTNFVLHCSNVCSPSICWVIGTSWCSDFSPQSWAMSLRAIFNWSSGWDGRAGRSGRVVIKVFQFQNDPLISIEYYLPEFFAWPMMLAFGGKWFLWAMFFSMRACKYVWKTGKLGATLWHTYRLLNLNKLALGDGKNYRGWQKSSSDSLRFPKI